MAEKVLMLALSPTMETGTIVRWTKREGDAVENGDILCEVETDKATMEYESMNEGTLLKIVIPEGKEAMVGQAIAVVGESGEDISGVLKEIESETEEAASQAPETEAAIKTGVQLESRQIETAEQTGRGAVQPEETLPGGVKASPLARILAEKYRIDLKTVRGSGPDGRIVRRDIDSAGAMPPAVHADAGGRITELHYETAARTIPLSGKRKVIAQRLAESKYSAPHYYLKTAVGVDNLFAARKRLNQTMKGSAVYLNAFLMKFVAEALRRHPVVNSSWQGESILQYGTADIGLAVAQPDGLITPIVRNCWNRGILEIDEELKVLIEKALDNRLKPEEYTGATFTISNLGSYGVYEFTAIINPPGSAILAVGEARKEPVVEEDNQVHVKTIMRLTLSCDHRVIDGVEGARFLKDLKDMIENPIKVLY